MKRFTALLLATAALFAAGCASFSPNSLLMPVHDRESHQVEPAFDTSTGSTDSTFGDSRC